MPELAEVEYFRKVWAAAMGERVRRAEADAGSRVFREADAASLPGAMRGAELREARACGKWMVFGFSGGRWLGVHLGMTGRLFRAPPGRERERHDRLLLRGEGATLGFADPRHFGRVRFDRGAGPPEWWRRLPPAVVSEAFRFELFEAFLRRRGRSPVKAVLLMQERFPGVGNWMADEALWRAGVRPDAPAGRIGPRKRRELYEALREVCRGSLECIGVDWTPPPDDWLFGHRWKDGGRCPATGARLKRAPVGGRTTCWCPAKQTYRGRR